MGPIIMKSKCFHCLAAPDPMLVIFDPFDKY